MRSLKRWVSSSGLVDAGGVAGPVLLRQSDSTDSISESIEALREIRAATLLQRMERGRAVRSQRRRLACPACPAALGAHPGGGATHSACVATPLDVQSALSAVYGFIVIRVEAWSCAARLFVLVWRCCWHPRLVVHALLAWYA